VLINGVEITDIDVCDYAVMERYEAAHDVVLEKSKQAKQVCKRRSELIKYQCEVVFEFIDTVFGEGTAKKVFGDSCNLRTALAVYEEVTLAVNKLDNQFNESVNNHFKSGKKNSQKQNSGKIYPNPNYHHKKKKRR
jgi:hypothetical protein